MWSAVKAKFMSICFVQFYYTKSSGIRGYCLFISLGIHLRIIILSKKTSRIKVHCTVHFDRQSPNNTLVFYGIMITRCYVVYDRYCAKNNLFLTVFGLLVRFISPQISESINYYVQRYVNEFKKINL